MNIRGFFFRCALAALVLCAGFFWIAAGRAQTASQTVDNRFLFIFNTSSDMKKRSASVQAEVNQLLATSLGGQLSAGDSIGVWTFDQDLRTGQYPLQRWRPEDAVAIASRINKFVSGQRYANRTRFAALQPELNRVIQGSGRLTILIFCDGEDEIHWTPYDASINQVFKQRQAEQKRAQQPFVLVLRTQLGKYAGSTMNFPPGMVSLPEFPPWPAPPPAPAPVKTPTNEPAPAPAVQPVITGPPLIIVGTNVMTNWPPKPAPTTPANVVPSSSTNEVVATNPIVPAPTSNETPASQTNAAHASATVPITPTNVVAPGNPAMPPSPTSPASAVQAGAVISPPTNPAAATPATLVAAPPAASTPATNETPAAPGASGSGHKNTIIAGVALLVVAVALAAFAILRRRPRRGSLITRSMRKD
ncbi:MAG TPA: hypothetical protein VFY06_03140 [Verrucomicrobiae bacterium]|nr:hypothetical protein [Verrucomicrobiae bacterium]